MKTQFVVNPISGINRNPQKIVRWIESVFGEADREFEVVYTRGPGDATTLAARAVDAGVDVLVAVGGDGTINEIGRALVHTNVALGVVPAGSGNGFARNFGIPLNQRKAIEALLSPRFIKIDAGKMNSHYFFNVAGVGLDALISRNFEQFGVRGPLPYFVVGARAFLSYQPEKIRLVGDDGVRECQPLLLSLANAPQYGNGAIIAPRAQPDDGLLDVCILDPLPLWKAASNIYRMFNGTIEEIEEFRTFQTAALTIEREGPGPIHTDGNPHEDDAVLRVEAIPGALKVAIGLTSATEAEEENGEITSLNFLNGLR